MYKKLLVPVDGTEISTRAMQSSIALARQLGAALVAFIAEPQPALPLTGPSSVSLDEQLREHDARTRRHASEILARFEGEARNAGVAFEGHFTQDDRIDEAIARTAHELGCDMIVMATHGRGRLGELLYGSTTKGVMARTKLPLLVLH